MTIFSRFEELLSNFDNLIANFNPIEEFLDFLENAGSVVPIIFLSISLVALLIKSAEG